MSQSGPATEAPSNQPAVSSRWELLHISQRLEQRPTLAGVTTRLLDALIPETSRPTAGRQHLYLAQPSRRKSAPWRFTPLEDLLIQRYLLDQALELPMGDLVTPVSSGSDAGSPWLSQADLTQVLEAAGPRLLRVFQSQLIDFWNEPVCQGQNLLQRISSYIAGDLTAEANTLPHAEQLLLQTLIKHPYSDIQISPAGQAQASIVLFAPCLEDGSQQGLAIRHINPSGAALLYTLNSGLVRYADAGALESHLSDQLAAPTPGFRPRQNVFDAFATTLLEQQLQHLSDIKPDSYKTPSALSRYVDSLVNPDALFSRIRALGNTVAGKSAYQQPAWMHHAPVADRQVIAKQLAALAMFEQTSKVKALPSLERYTTDALDTQIRKDHPGQALPSASEFMVQVYDYTPPFFDPFHLTGGSSSHPRKPLSLVQVALFNTQALPLERSDISLRSGQPLPAWASAGYFRQLISRVDIGKAYPQFLQHALLDDEQQAVQQQTLFVERLRILLPIQLIAPRPQGEGKLSEQARHCALAAFAPATDPVRNSVQLSQLALQLSHHSSPAVHAPDMFIIEPADSESGPCVLYAPQGAPQLLEFNDRAALLLRINQPGPVHEAVVRALPEGAVRDALRLSLALYNHGAVSSSNSQSLTLAHAPVGDNAFHLIYQANAQALIEQARQATTSDAEQRRITVKKILTLALSVLLPLLDGPLAEIAWIAQIYASVHALKSAVLNDDTQAEKNALVEVLLQTSLLLVHAGMRTAVPRPVEARPVAELTNEIRKRPSLTQLPQLPADTLLDFNGWASPTLSAHDLEQLRALSIAPIDPLDGALSQQDQLGLFSHQGQPCVRLPEGWFLVQQGEDEAWRIIDPHSSGLGPGILRNSKGSWQLNLRLRLRGGAPLSVRALKRLKSLLHEARTLLDNEAREISTGERSMDSPVEIEELLETKAQARQTCANNLEQLVNDTADQSTRISIVQLRASADRLRQAGRRLRIERLKTLPPTATGIDFLNDQGEVVITRVGGRKDVSGGKGRDFMEEFSIKDRRGKPLAFAHFHYSSATSAEANYTAAHIKKPEQRFMGLGMQMNQESSGSAVTAIYRDRISPQLAKKLFLRW